MPVRGQLWYLTQGAGGDARLTYINGDGTNSNLVVDNDPTLDLATPFPEDVVVDTAAHEPQLYSHVKCNGIEVGTGHVSKDSERDKLRV